MSVDGPILTPTILRTLSVPAAPKGGPAAPLKDQIRARSHPSPDESEAESAESNSNFSGPRNLFSAFDAVATKPGVSIDSAASIASTAGLDGLQDEDQTQSLTLPLPEAPVTPDALPKASISQRLNDSHTVAESPSSPPSKTSLHNSPQPAAEAPSAADQAQVCPPSPPQSARSATVGLNQETSVPTTEEILSMGYKGASLPHDDTERLRTVALLGILDQPEDPVLASITKLVVRLLKVSTVGEQPVACIVSCTHRPSNHTVAHRTPFLLCACC